MGSLAITAANINKMLEAQMTDAEFDAEVKRSRFLHECKSKKFKMLESMGNLGGGIKLMESATAAAERRNEDTLTFAKECKRMVEEEGMTLTAAADKFGRNPGDIKYYCIKHGIEPPTSPFKKRDWDYSATLPKILKLINEDGYRLRHCAQKLNTSPSLIMNVIKHFDMRYDAKKIRVVSL